MSSSNLCGRVWRSRTRILLFSGVLAAVLVTVSCGGNGNTSMGSLLGSATPAMVQLRMGDAPADRVISFEVTVGPITLMPSSGTSLTALSGTRRIELSHLSGTNEALALLNVSAGSYSSATITVANPEVTFINNLGAVVKLEPILNQTITINFNPVLTVGAGVSVVNIDLSLANSLTFDAQGNVTSVNVSSSSFTVSAAAVAAEAQQEAEDGEFEDTTGMVTGVSANSFTLSQGQSTTPLTFITDSNTAFSDGASMATILNMIVKVEGVTKSDGTLYAKEVEGVENNNGVEAEGLITKVTNNPATQLSVVAQDGNGAGIDDTKIGSPLLVDVTGAQYGVDQGNIDTSGIGGLPSSPNFPFDASTIHAGQRVQVESASAMSGMSVSSGQVKLKQQAVTGTVSGLTGPTSAGPVSFTLTLPADSAFAMLSGQTTINVFWQLGTDLHNLASVKNGDTARVRGLVFFSATNVNLIARRIGQ